MLNNRLITQHVQGQQHAQGQATIKMRFGLCLIMALSIALLAVKNARAADASEAAEGSELPYTITTVAEGLQQPYGIAFLPNGDLLITEKSGRLRWVQQGVLQAEPVTGVPEVYPSTQGGLLDIVLHPRFADNGWLYLSLSEGDYQANATQVVRARFSEGQLHDLKVIYTARPAKAKGVHFGARMTFLADETLLITIGDGFEFREDAQNLGSALGKIVRVTDEGEIPPDNPFVHNPNARPEIYSYGHRHPQGIVYDAKTHTVYAHEHGPMGGDELNRINAGSNYGWPLANYGLDYSGAYVSPLTAHPGTEQPLVQWTPSLAPSGLTQCRGCQWPEWEGDLLVGMLAGKQVSRIQRAADGSYSESALFGELNARVRDVKFGPEGALYLLLQNAQGQVLKVTSPKGNRVTAGQVRTHRS